MEAILKFNLEDRDDLMQFRRSCKSTQLALFTWSMAHISKRAEHCTTINELLDYIESELKEYNINIEEILE